MVFVKFRRPNGAARYPIDAASMWLSGASAGLRSGHYRRFAALLAGLVVAMSVAAHPFETAELRKPRASFIDITARMKVLRDSADAYLQASLPKVADCSVAAPLAPPTGAMVIPPRYASGNHGPINPDYEATVKLYRDFETIAATLANQYVATGDPRNAACLLDHLERWAKADALTGYTVSTDMGASNQAWYQAEWSASAAALALSQVLPEPSLSADKVNLVIQWLQRVSKQQISHPGGENTCCNNHAYWRGLHATMIGVLANDSELFRWGLGRYALAVEHLAPNGSWPLEMARHEQSLHYQNYALLPLVLIAEIAAQQGIDLYAYKVDGRDLHSAITFLGKSLSEYKERKATGAEKMDLRAFSPGRGDQAWGEFYRARFAKDPLGLLSKRVFNARTGGNATLLAYRPGSMGEEK